MRIRGAHHSFGLDIIRRYHDHHARDGAHQRKVLVALVGCAVLADRDTAVGRSNLHIQLRIADGIPNLLIGSARRKHRKRARKRDAPGRGNAGCDTNHVLLGNAAVDVALRKCLAEHRGLCGTREIGIQYEEILMFFSKFREGSAVALAGRNLFSLTHNISSALSSSARAFASSSSFGPLPCQPT